jgi:hypothetical protein
MATVLDTMDTPYDLVRSIGCILHGIHGHMTPVGMHPLGPKDQSTLGTNNRIPPTLSQHRIEYFPTMFQILL